MKRLWAVLLLSIVSLSVAAEKIDGKNVWSELPPFVLLDNADNERNLSEWRGKVLMVNFFATWCAPCRYEVPHLIKLQEEYGPQGLQIIGIGFDEGKKVKNYARSLEITYPVLVADPEQHPTLMKRWGNETGVIPYLFVVDQDGTVSMSQNGSFSERHFEWFVRPLLK
ncbi:MAG: TlpA family protein disulfide reductase [Gammaproteobacteria bacterium]|uniref:TlpA family protein disulfide reductase n=1 Tax=Candidatus Thiopontia autotrophica TaxID=2841688 RepID=A0A8J6P574_9GAMM|nr:TlpA family protein disulfide reductase [Candidatus Thiopontia autotrophica]MBL6969058.1 TlpA family protein disulfide reductase [Gammaproteobacteria bacterium]